MEDHIGNRGVWAIGSKSGHEGRIEAVVVGTLEAANDHADTLRKKLEHPDFRRLQISRVDASPNRTFVFHLNHEGNIQMAEILPKD